MIRIIHLSDFHFSSEPDKLNKLDHWRGHGSINELERRAHAGFFQTSHHSDLPARISEFISDTHESNSIDLVVVTGDLAATGLTKDLQFARAYFVSGNAYGVPRYPNLNFPKNRIFLMPGNHDRFQYGGLIPNTLGEAVSPGGLEFDDIFSDFWGQRAAGHCVAALDVPASSDSTPRITFLAADFCLQTKSEAEGLTDGVLGGYAGQGVANPQVLSALRAATLKKRQEGADVIIWLLHFPPIGLRDLADNERQLRLLNAETVMAAAHDDGVALILSGHLHRNCCWPDEGFVRVWCAGSAAVRGTKHFQLHEVILSSPSAAWVVAERKTYTLRRVQKEGFKFLEDADDRRSHTWRFK